MHLSNATCDGCLGFYLSDEADDVSAQLSTHPLATQAYKRTICLGMVNADFLQESEHAFETVVYLFPALY